MSGHKIKQVLNKLTMRERISLLSGKNSWSTASIKKHGIYSITMTDGPHGVRFHPEDTVSRIQTVTCFPTGISMAGSWNPDLIERMGKALAEETRAMGCDIILGPCINIIRHPVAGRTFESFSEDPYLIGRISVAYIKGVQSRGVGTSVKHYACNNQETERHRGSSEVDERTLREIYLPAFETSVKEAGPWTVMCSYNRINGEHASQNYYLLTEILKKEWGFKGFVVSDWGATHTIVEAKKAGLDLEMPGPGRYFGELLASAVHLFQIDEKAINDSVLRILKVLDRAGRLGRPKRAFKGSINTLAHQTIARKLAEESIVLLKNDNNLLPLDLKNISSIAVIGPNAMDIQPQGEGSSHVEPFYTVQPLQALKKQVGKKVKINYTLGCDNFASPPTIKKEYLSPGNSKVNGLMGEYFNNPTFSGRPVFKRIDDKMAFWWWGKTPDKRITVKQFSIRWKGIFTSPGTGRYLLQVTNTGTIRIYLDNKMILQNSSPDQTEGYDMKTITKSSKISLVKGKRYKIKIEYIKNTREYITHVNFMIARIYKPGEDKRIQEAVELARKSDIALVFVGYPIGYETEGWDRPDIKLTNKQDNLISAVTRANKNTVVIINAGCPVEMPWVNKVPAIVDMFYPGMEGGNAVVNILTGKVNPSGKLPVTFPESLKDCPAYSNFPGFKKVCYKEGIFVGYRHYDKKKIKPLFPFGHGLSYTTFEYSDLKVPDRIRQSSPILVSFRIKNTGRRTGKEVVQLYIGDKKSSLPRPCKELKGFKKVSLKPGESRIIRFTLNKRSLSFYNPGKGKWIAEPGEFIVMVGTSSQNIQLKKSFILVN